MQENDSLHEYQQSIQAFLKRQFSSSTFMDKDIVEMDLDDTSSDLRQMNSVEHFNSIDFHSPVYPAMFLNNNPPLEEDETPLYSYYQHFHDNTSIDDDIDYFSLAVNSSQGK